MRWTFDQWLTACGAEMSLQFNWTLEHSGLRGFDWSAAYGRGLTVRAACDAAYDHVQETALDGAVYFNCCTGNTAPDWSAFRSLEIGGCKMVSNSAGESYVHGNQAPDDSAFWTVYAREHDGCALAITDCGILTETHAIAETLSRLSGLPLI
ncbi:hypothetical protein [Bradyrhizobium embrapense]|uniref:hypothetical protein n=1 Tax=Bradyrhizobium embrapense TaxID=630921 RepID=UPI00067DA7AC|nr:hypothetical protein [Bradyrhizobium embrapense]